MDPVGHYDHPVRRKLHEGRQFLALYRQRGCVPFRRKRKGHKMNDYDELPLMLSVTEVAAVLGIPRAGAYELVHGNEFPVLKISSRIVVPKDKFLAWIDANSGSKNAPL